MLRLLYLCFIVLLFTWHSSGAQQLPSLIPYVDGGKWGYADSNGKVMIKPTWSEVDFFCNGRAKVYFNFRNGDSYYCLIDVKGNYIIPPYRKWNGVLYKSLDRATYNAVAKTGKWGIIDSNNRELITCVYEKSDGSKNEAHWSGTFYSDSIRRMTFMTAKKDGKYGIIDTLNRVLVPFKYDGIFRPYSQFWGTPPGYWLVVVKGKHGLIDTQNNVLQPPVYEHIMWSSGEKYKRIWLWKDDRRMIADSNGKIIIDIPGYSADFPQDSLIPVNKIKGRSCMMNMKYEVVIPCEYSSVWVRNDTITALRDSVHTDGSHHWYHKYFDRKTFQPISGFVPPPAYVPVPVPPGDSMKRAFERRYPIKIRVNGRDTTHFVRDGITWWRPAYMGTQYEFASLRGLDADSNSYITVMDTFGRFLISPQRSKAIITGINIKDKLVVLSYNDEKTTTVADFGLEELMPRMKDAVIRTSFYGNNTLYAVVLHTHRQLVYYDDRGESEIRKFVLITQNGDTAKALKKYELISMCDRFGYHDRADQESVAFAGDFEGYFLVRDSANRVGIVDINGNINLPQISFKYGVLNAAGDGLFLVRNYAERNYYSRYSIESSPPFKRRGQPYLVDSNNTVLLDSMTIEHIHRATTPCGNKGSYLPLFRVQMIHAPGAYFSPELYIDSKRHTYYGKFPTGENEL